ncbi:hypothetical protein Tco_0993789 [Tanacetum coccineum]
MLMRRKYKAKRDAIAIEKAKVEEELVKTKFLKSGEFNQAFTGVLAMAISVGVERGLRMDPSDMQFKELSQRVSQSSQSSLQDIARPKPDKVVLSRKTSSATTSLRANTHGRHSTPSYGTFGHTSTPEHLKKKKFVGTGAPSSV